MNADVIIANKDTVIQKKIKQILKGVLKKYPLYFYVIKIQIKF